MIFVVISGLQGESEGRACRPPGALWTRRRRSAPRDRRLLVAPCHPLLRLRQWHEPYLAVYGVGVSRGKQDEAQAVRGEVIADGSGQCRAQPLAATGGVDVDIAQPSESSC
jgi:hypothetical protein